MVSKIQSGFVAGELSPSLYARVTLEKFNYGCRKLYNFWVHAHGGASNRSGLKFDGQTKFDSKESILIPFQFNTTQAYQLEFGDQYMRVWKDGGLVLETSKNITGVENVANPKFTIVGHGLSVDHWVYITELPDGTGGTTKLSTLNGRFYKVNTVVDADHVKLTRIEGQSLDTTGWAAYTSGGKSSKVYEISTPYVEADIKELDYFQSADIMTLLHELYQQRELTRSGHASWTLSTITFQSQVATPTTGPTLTTSGSLSSGNKKCQYKYTRVVGGEESLPSPMTEQTTMDAWASGTSMKVSIPDQSTLSPPLAAADSYNVYKRWGNFSTMDGPYGWIGTTTEDDGRVFVDTNLQPDSNQYVLRSNRNPFNAAGYYPSCGAYFKQRRCFGAPLNEPDILYTTQVGHMKNMNINNPNRDSDAIVYEIASTEVNKIQYMVPMDKLILLTTGGPFVIQGDQNGVFSPATINGDKNGTEGCDKVKPIVVGGTAIYSQDQVSGLMAVAYTFADNKFVGNDLSILATHLFEGRRIVSMTYQKSPMTLIHCAMDDGMMLTLTYQKENNVFAWTQCETQGQIEWLSTIPAGSESRTSAIVRRKINGVWRRYVESFSTRTIKEVRDAKILDSCISYDNPIAITGITIDAVTGLAKVTSATHGLSDEDRIELSDIDGAEGLNLQKAKVGDSHTNTLYLKAISAEKNYIRNPIDIGGTGWTINDCTIVTGQPDPYGGNNAIKVTVTGPNASIKQTFSATSSIVKKYTLFARSDGGLTSGITFGGKAGILQTLAAVMPQDWTAVMEAGGGTPDVNDGISIYFNDVGDSGSSSAGNIYYLYGPKAVASNSPKDFQSDYINAKDAGSYDSGGYMRLMKKVLSGAWHLEGMTVNCLADGNPVKNLTVTNGQITLPQYAARVHIGLPFTSELETLDLEIDQLNSYGRKKSVSEMTVKIKDSRGGQYGPGDRTKQLFDIKQRTTENMGDTIPLITDEFTISIAGTWEKNGRMRIVQEDPLPLTILSIAPEVEIGG